MTYFYCKIFDKSELLSVVIVFMPQILKKKQKKTLASIGPINI